MFVVIFSKFHPLNRQTKNCYRFNQTMLTPAEFSQRQTSPSQELKFFFPTHSFLITNDFPPICDGYQTSLTILGIHHIFEQFLRYESIPLTLQPIIKYN